MHGEREASLHPQPTGEGPTPPVGEVLCSVGPRNGAPRMGAGGCPVSVEGYRSRQGHDGTEVEQLELGWGEEQGILEIRGGSRLYSEGAGGSLST